ncbi:uncharacterized protein LOC117103869 isoform X2 [Anneissia japonica]|uniref:uncharacterized protein LOC117103869 isoform X2 n=1 Tax=Anneissia japonica TaxID=1529436 RepID=UPI0014255AB5|nr:uncharacterized protein LOC117103869 isoform X2 [Anneissia japonica]
MALSVTFCLYTILLMAQGNTLDTHIVLETGGNSKVSLLDRRKRLANNDFVSRCWNDVNGTIVNSVLQGHCLYITQNERICYKLMQLSGNNNMEAVEECTRTGIGYELADVNSAVILDAISELVNRLVSIFESGGMFAESGGSSGSGSGSGRSRPMTAKYWLLVNSPLQNVPKTGGCSSYDENFYPHAHECTYLQIEENEYKVGKCPCNNSQHIDGFICQSRLEVTRDTPTTTLTNIFPDDDDITTIDYKVSSGVTSTHQPEQEVSKMSNVTLILIASAVAVVCMAVLVILLLKRRTSTKGVPDVPTTQVKQAGHGDNSSNQYSNYGASLPGDYVQLSDITQKIHNPNYIVVDGDVYNNQYENPMLPVSVENSKAESLLNDPQHDVVHLEEVGNINPQYDVLNREKEGSLDPQYYVLDREKEESFNTQYDMLNREKKGSLHPEYDVLNRE